MSASPDIYVLGLDEGVVSFEETALVLGSDVAATWADRTTAKLYLATLNCSSVFRSVSIAAVLRPRGKC